MKKVLIILLFLLFPLPAFAQDYWVYIRLEDRVGPKDEDTAGRSKAGDIVAVLPDTPQYQPTDQEKSEYLIVKTSNITPEEKSEMLIKGETKAGVKGQYRKNKVKVEELGVQVKKGISVTPVDKEIIKDKSAEKTESDIIAYRIKTRFYAYFGRPYERLAQLIIPFAHAVTVSKINMATEDYNTLTLWEDAKDGILTDIQRADCYNDQGGGVLDDFVIIDGSTTTSITYMYITAPVGERHLGIAGAGFVLTPSGGLGTNEFVIGIQDEYTIVEWVEVTGWFASFNAAGHGIGYKGVYNYGVIVRNNLVHDDNNAGGDSCGIWLENNTGDGNTVNNNFVWNIAAEGILNYGAFGGGSFEINNNTVYNYNTRNNGHIGIQGGASASANIKNNISIAGANGGATFDIGSVVEGNYNATSEASLSEGANNQYNLTTSIFVSTSDLHIDSGTVIDGGVDLGTTSGVNVDINAYTRVGTWDIGAHEIAGAAATATVIDFF